MGVFDKLKNILFEDVEEEEIPVIKETKKVEKEKVEKPKIEEEPVKEDVIPKKVEEVSRFKNINYEEDIEEEIKEKKLEETSPFQQFDEEEFERIATINKNRLIERDKKLREEKMEAENRVQKIANKKEHEIIKEEKTASVPPKRFIPSPVISPVYGILDKNYKKEDILPRASSDGTLPKIMDVDTVREKAFGILDDEDEMITEEVKITSFDEDQVDDIEEEVETPVVKKKSSKKEEPKEELIEDDIEDITEEINIPEDEEEVVEEVEEPTNEEADEDELESDLFNLIDSMYQDEEE